MLGRFRVKPGDCLRKAIFFCSGELEYALFAPRSAASRPTHLKISGEDSEVGECFRLICIDLPEWGTGAEAE